jgi:phage portal protein BeeE
MARFANLIKGLTSPFVDDADPDSAREKRTRVRDRRRSRFNSADRADKGERGQTRKDEHGGVDRTVTVNRDVRESIGGNVRSKPYDPVFLRDISANAVVQAYVDTLAQDVAGANWSIKPRDEDADISDEALASVERRLRDLPPGSETFRDLLESTTRALLELGDAALVKHYYEADPGRVAELIPVDSASMFKLVDEHGLTEGFVQISRRDGTTHDDFRVDDVVWVEWSSRSDRFYGQGPLEKAQNEVELIEELAEKERLDLLQGGPPGVLSPEALDEYGGLPNDEDWDTFVEGMRLDEGERHRVGYSKTPVQFEPINGTYQELQILDRSKYWVTVIGSVFKVNPSYAGFDFENVNRATDESQRAAYQQRGFRVTLRQLEESLNEGLIWADYSDDIKFEFEQEQTIGEKADRAGLLESQATAGQEMADAGRDVAYRDGRVVVEDGAIEAPDDSVGGGLFGSVDATPGVDAGETGSRKDDDGVRLHVPQGGIAHSDDGDWTGFLRDVARAGGRIIDTKGFDNGSDRVYPPAEPDPHDPRMVVYGLDETDVLSVLDRHPDVHLRINTDADSNVKAKATADPDAARKAVTVDAVCLRAFERQIVPPSVAAIEKDAWTSDEDVPEYVVDHIETVVDTDGVWDDFKSLPGRVADVIQGTLKDALTQPQGWSLDSMVDRMADELPRADPDDLETIARTESASVLNDAREDGYRDRGLDDALFYWQGPSDSRETDACEDLKDETNPSYGGDPVPLSELVTKERNVHAEYFDNLSFRKHVIHPNERHTFVRATGTGTDIDVDVDVPSAEELQDDFDSDDAAVDPVELSANDDTGHDDRYHDVVTRVAKATDPTRRMREVERAVGGYIPSILRECLEASGGSKEGALRELNRRLRDADGYDHDEHGEVSKPTLYEWAGRYDTHVDHLT